MMIASLFALLPQIPPRNKKKASSISSISREKRVNALFKNPLSKTTSTATKPQPQQSKQPNQQSPARLVVPVSDSNAGYKSSKVLGESHSANRGGVGGVGGGDTMFTFSVNETSPLTTATTTTTTTTTTSLDRRIGAAARTNSNIKGDSVRRSVSFNVPCSEPKAQVVDQAQVPVKRRRSNLLRQSGGGLRSVASVGSGVKLLDTMLEGNEQGQTQQQLARRKSILKKTKPSKEQRGDKQQQQQQQSANDKILVSARVWVHGDSTDSDDDDENAIVLKVWVSRTNSTFQEVIQLLHKELWKRWGVGRSFLWVRGNIRCPIWQVPVWTDLEDDIEWRICVAEVGEGRVVRLLVSVV
ncbi:hypothetical protein BDR26DRAFT_915636 [Obelidium mucronatum]|nr:hypothetical protein BDR26DRAFT_915636 [Obelidium mucronatum]